MMINRLAAPIFALLLVTAGVAGPMAQPASATHDCDEVDALVAFATFTTVNADKCTNNHVAHVVEDMEKSDANQTKVDIYNAGLEQHAQSDVAMATRENYVNDTESVAWMKAESAIAEAYENGSSKAVAKSRARTAIAEYYAVKQHNLLESWDVSINSYETLWTVAQNESGITQGPFDDIFTSNLAGDGFVTHNGTYNTDGRYYPGLRDIRNQNVSLVNGSTKEVRSLRFETYDTDDNHWDNYATMSVHPGMSEGNFSGTGAAHVNGEGYFETGYPGNYNYELHYLAINPPNSNYNEAVYLRPGRYWEVYDRIETQNTNLQNEVGAFVNNTWTEYNSGKINSSDVLNRNTQMFEYGTTATSSEGSLYDSVAALSSMGLDTPTLNGTGTMTVTHDNVQYHGLVMAREAPNGTWKANTTYNGSNIAGPVFIATTGGKQVDLDGEFRIGTISNTAGDPMTSVTADKTNYKTANTTELLDKMDRLLELRQTIENKGPSGGAGGGSGGMEPNSMLIIGVAVAAALLLAGRRNGGGRRGRR
jgi:hypothetical protein